MSVRVLGTRDGPRDDLVKMGFRVGEDTETETR